ncbi:branched-chain amino acid ABC transporter permease [Streptomyces sp. NPDC086549]|uniref:branched-chain amino acid ABC transporter permease n=1 Tax=Streptomyces sp. NPDC086549 TaxID=3365752 RepID=UPI00382619B4
MHTLLQAILLGILTGGVYALMASGQTLVFGIMRVINLAQGALVVLSAYLSYTLFTWAGIDPFLGILIVTPVMFVLGVTVQWVFLRPLKSEDGELSLLVMFAVALAVEGVLASVYKTTFRSINTTYRDTTWNLGDYRLPVTRLAAFGLSLAVLGGLWLLLHRTRFGASVRATVQNPTAARLLGVNPERVSALGFGLGTATAGAAGAVFGLVYPFNSGSHYDLIARLLAIVVLGGLGSLGGAVVAGVLMGVAEAVVAATWSPSWAGFTFFTALLLVLLLRPQGLFGTRLRGAL